MTIEQSCPFLTFHLDFNLYFYSTIQRVKQCSALLLGLWLLSMSSCKQDPATLQLQVLPTWGGATWAMNTTYSTPDSKYLNFTVNKMFLSHIKLVKNDNSEVEVSAANFVNFESNNTISLLAPVGDYKALKFGIGLDSAQNHINPTANSTDAVFGADPGMWWDVTLYHLFADIEGHAGTTTALGTTFFYHVGTDSFYKTATVPKSFSISNGQNTTLKLNADFQKLFYGGGANTINVITEPYTHTTDAPTTAHKLADGSTQIFSLQ